MPTDENAMNDAAPQTETPREPAPATQPARAEKSKAPKSEAPKTAKAASKPKAAKAVKTKAPKAAKPKTAKPKTVKPKAAKPKAKKASKLNKASTAPKPAKPAKTVKPKTVKPKAKKAAKAKKPSLPATGKTAQLLSSETVFDGPLFRVQRDRLIEPSGKQTTRDIIRHNGSAVILALDTSKSKKDPWVVMERQYRHATGQFLWELPAGKLEAGESPLEGAQRELEEETGYRAKKWKPLVEYFASPGFLGEAMKVFVAEGLSVGNTNWDEDEHIEIRLVKLSELLKKIEKGEILDGKTLIGVLSYARHLGRKRGK